MNRISYFIAFLVIALFISVGFSVAQSISATSDLPNKDGELSTDTTKEADSITGTSAEIAQIESVIHYSDKKERLFKEPAGIKNEEGNDNIVSNSGGRRDYGGIKSEFQFTGIIQEYENNVLKSELKYINGNLIEATFLLTPSIGLPCESITDCVNRNSSTSPNVEITRPDNNAVFPGPIASIEIAFKVDDNSEVNLCLWTHTGGSGITETHFYQGDIKQSYSGLYISLTELNDPENIISLDLEEGSHQIVVSCRDGSGNTGTDSVSLTVEGDGFNSAEIITEEEPLIGSGGGGSSFLPQDLGCSEWSQCSNGQQNRICTNLLASGETVDRTETRACTNQQVGGEGTNLRSLLTGAFIGSNGQLTGLGWIFGFFLVIVMVALIVYLRKA